MPVFCCVWVSCASFPTTTTKNRRRFAYLCSSSEFSCSRISGSQWVFRSICVFRPKLPQTLQNTQFVVCFPFVKTKPNENCVVRASGTSSAPWTRKDRIRTRGFATSSRIATTGNQSSSREQTTTHNSAIFLFANLSLVLSLSPSRARAISLSHYHSLLSLSCLSHVSLVCVCIFCFVLFALCV